jgi:uncharacterized protein YaiL (DUF2058 family)
MSLRDQLLKAGVVDKKKVAEVNRSLKDQRKQEQGQREARSVVQAREEAQRQATAAAERAARQAEQQAREAAREEAERQRTVGNLLRSHRLPDKRGPQRFYHRAPDGRTLLRLDLPESIAWELRRGRLAIAWAGDPARPDILLVPSPIARRVAELHPGRVLFHNAEPPAWDDPSEELYGAR